MHLDYDTIFVRMKGSLRKIFKQNCCKRETDKSPYMGFLQN